MPITGIFPSKSGGILPQFVITVLAGSTVKCTSADGETVLTATSIDGTCTINVPSYGEWSVTATLGGDNTTREFVQVDCVKQYVITLKYVNVFGVVWDTHNSSTALTRLTAASDPYNYVNTDVVGEPLGDTYYTTAGLISRGSSPFDNYMPWKGMEIYDVIDGKPLHKKGEEGFVYNYETEAVVYIPKFYYKTVSTADKGYFYVSDKPCYDFEVHPGSGRFIGRYKGKGQSLTYNSTYDEGSISRTTARELAHNKGDGWHLNDFATWSACCLLYLVEFANWNSQSKIGAGCVSVTYLSSVKMTGEDRLSYHTGSFLDPQQHVQDCVKYRNIEDLWGYQWEWVDGINFSDYRVYLCSEPSKYADTNTDDYISTGINIASSGYISNLGFSTAFPWAFLPIAGAGSSSTYIPDKVEGRPGTCGLMVGGCFSDGDGAGLFTFSLIDASYSASQITSRIMYIPSEEEITNYES